MRSADEIGVHRVSSWVALTLVLVASLAACGGKTDDAPGTAGGPSGGDAAACTTIVPSDYDQSCETGADCAAVVLGGDTCHPCAEPADWVCPADTMNVRASAAYQAALTQALGAAPSEHFAVDVCGGAVSCPLGSPACVSGKCTIVIPHTQ
jgi:hypothetical protein